MVFGRGGKAARQNRHHHGEDAKGGERPVEGAAAQLALPDGTQLIENVHSAGSFAVWHWWLLALLETAPACGGASTRPDRVSTGSLIERSNS
jgi:hypothetical protein